MLGASENLMKGKIFGIHFLKLFQMIFSSKFQVNFTNKSHLSLKKRLIYYSFLFLFHQ